ncbi:MAG: hypothetical protein M1398_03160 [Deltaproteobacteria bacterium]|nr:hypothetical protein [Deltaproteobacteria bacterium]
MILKPQDILILIKLVVLGKSEWSYAPLGLELSMSPSEVHSGLKRAVAARLFDEQRRKPVKKALEEFLVHGVKYAFPPSRGGLTRGMPTSFAGPPLRDLIVASGELPPVWPDPEGEEQGYEFSPLYKSVPKAAAKDFKLYELLVLVDAIRDSRAREREIAVNEIKARLQLND